MGNVNCIHKFFPHGFFGFSRLTIELQNHYDDDDIPEVDLPKDQVPNDADYTAEPLPEKSSPRKDGPGGK